MMASSVQLTPLPPPPAFSSPFAAPIASSAVPAIPEHRVLREQYNRQRRGTARRQLNARLDPTYNAPISQIALYKAWLSKRRREAFAASPLAGYVSAHWAAMNDDTAGRSGGGGSGSGSGSGSSSGGRGSAMGGVSGGVEFDAVATTGALPAHSAVLGLVRRRPNAHGSQSSRPLHPAPFIPSNASEAKRQTARKPVGGQQTPYDSAHGRMLEAMLASRAAQQHPNHHSAAGAVSGAGGGSGTAGGGGGGGAGGGVDSRPPFYPTRPSEAKAKIETNAFMYSADERTATAARQRMRDRAAANSRLLSARFLHDTDSDAALLHAATADFKYPFEDTSHARGSASSDDDSGPDGAADSAGEDDGGSGEDAGTTAAAITATTAAAATAAGSQSARGSDDQKERRRRRRRQKHRAFPRSPTAALGRPPASQLPKHSHLLSPAQLAHFANAPKFSAHIHTTYYPTPYSRPGSARGSMSDLLGDPALSVAGLSEDKSKFVRNKRGEWVRADANAAHGARKPKLPAFGVHTSAGPTHGVAHAPPKLITQRHSGPNSLYGHGHDPTPPPPIKTVSLLRHFFAE